MLTAPVEVICKVVGLGVVVWALAELECKGVVALICGVCHACTKLVASHIVPILRAEI